MLFELVEARLKTGKMSESVGLVLGSPLLHLLEDVIRIGLDGIDRAAAHGGFKKPPGSISHPRLTISSPLAQGDGSHATQHL